MAGTQCPQCGQARNGIQRYCSNCGFDYGWADAQAKPSAPTVAPAQGDGASQVGETVGKVVGFLIIAVLVWFFFLRGDGEPTDAGGNGGDNGSEAVDKDITGEFTRWEPVDDGNGYAYFSITNHGSSTAVAECSISVRNAFGDFGFDKLVGESVPAGETITGRIALDVGEGAFLIDEGEVDDC